MFSLIESNSIFHQRNASHVGLNDLMWRNEGKLSDEELVNIIQNIGTNESHGVSNDFISGIFRNNRVNVSNLNRLNALLEEASKHHRFSFINNAEISERYILKDGVHLKETGKIIFANN